MLLQPVFCLDDQAITREDRRALVQAIGCSDEGRECRHIYRPQKAGRCGVTIEPPPGRRRRTQMGGWLTNGARWLRLTST